MDGLDGELTKMTEDFLRAVDVEALRLAKNIGRNSLSQLGCTSFTAISCRANSFA